MAPTDIYAALNQIAVLLVVYGAAWLFYSAFVRFDYVSGLKQLQSPPARLLTGSIPDTIHSSLGAISKRWTDALGPVCRYRTFFGVRMM